MNYQIWVEHVRTFLERRRRLPGEMQCTVEIDPPLSDADVADLGSRWPNGVPETLNPAKGETAELRRLFSPRGSA